MPKWTRAVFLIAPIALVAAPVVAQDMPEGVTTQMIEEGGKLYRGDGICYACHGQDGKGMQGLGANLADDEWLHSDGSVEGILKTIINGVSGDKSSVGVSMPAGGGSALSDEKLSAVAAYVWSLRTTDK
jgi:cbb3-type cytochrome c oxidase subunit III